jgi:hypothetical protein
MLYHRGHGDSNVNRFAHADVRLPFRDVFRNTTWLSREYASKCVDVVRLG